MKRLTFKLPILALSIFFFSIACNKDDDKVEAGFSLMGTWSLERVEVSASLLGADLNDTDEEPTGTITFSDNGKGVTAYEFTLLQLPYGSAGAFAWQKDENTVTIANVNGTDIWKILESSDKKLVAEWTEVMEGSQEGTFKIELSR